MKESARYILPILVFVALILSIGTVGYLAIEDDISVSDAFYMTATAITPAQFDEVHQLTVAGRYFTVVLVFCGFGAVVAFATQFARLIVQSELEGVGVITRKQMSRRIKRMKNHYIVCGYGDLGSAICGELQGQNLPFVVITDDDPSISAIGREGHALVRGNPTADNSLKEAGIERAAGVIALLHDDSNNLFIALAARELNPKILIIARAEDRSLEDRILRAGADIVVSPTKLGGRQIAALIQQQTGISPPLSQKPAASTVLGMRLSAYRHTDEQPLSVAEAIGNHQAVAAAGIQRGNGAFEPSPPPDALLNRGDALALVTRSEDVGATVQKRTTGKTILIADDHRALRLLFARKLAAAGHDVLQAATGSEALMLARSALPDLIVLDVNMPQQNGYDVCKQLRHSERFSAVPIILYSGEQETAGFSRLGSEAGADMCLRKSSKSSELLAHIEEAFSMRKKESLTSSPNTENHEFDAKIANVDQRNSNHLEFDIDDALEIVDGDLDLLSEMVNDVLNDSPRLMEEIKGGLNRGDFETMRLAAHNLKSLVSILGAKPAIAAAQKVESSASEEDSDAAQKACGNLESRLDALVESLQLHRSSLAK